MKSLYTISLLLLISCAAFAQHVYDSIYFTAISDTGMEFPSVVMAGDQGSFVLPKGKYLVTLRTKNPDLVERYVHFIASDSILVPGPVHISGGVTQQAMIRIRKDQAADPPIVFIRGENNRGWTMFESDSVYYAYVAGGTKVTIYLESNEFTIQPQAGELWDLDISVFQVQYDGNPLFDELIQPEPAPQPQRIMAIDWQDHSGIVVQDSIAAFIEPGDWMKFSAIDLTGKTKIRFRFSYASNLSGRTMEFRTGLTEQPLAVFTQEPTASWNDFEEREIEITPTAGVHDLYITFSGITTQAYNYVLNLDWFELR